MSQKKRYTKSKYKNNINFPKKLLDKNILFCVKILLKCHKSHKRNATESQSIKIINFPKTLLDKNILFWCENFVEVNVNCSHRFSVQNGSAHQKKKKLIINTVVTNAYFFCQNWSIFC